MEHIVKNGEGLLKIAADHGIPLAKLLAANPRYKSDPESIRVGDKVIIPPADTSAVADVSSGQQESGQTASSDADDFTVPKGQLTFDAEGLETRGRHFSRVPHVPGPWSGVTIGRGYDMRERSENEIIEDLTSAGVSLDRAKKLAMCRSLSGDNAQQFLKDNDLTGIEITPAEQKVLFMLTYQEMEGDVIRICNKQDVVNKYGPTDWDNLNPLIKDISVDLRYRGDYTGATREKVQPMLVENSLEDLKDVMGDQQYWVSTHGVPLDRFERRRDYLMG